MIVRQHDGQTCNPDKGVWGASYPQPKSLVLTDAPRTQIHEANSSSPWTLYPVKGDLKLHYCTEDGKEEIAEVPEGSVIYTHAGTPDSPRFAPDANLLVVERQRREGEVDRFQWYCPKCDALLHEEGCVVSNYRADPVSKAYAEFFGSEESRTCRKCHNVMPKPQAA